MPRKPSPVHLNCSLYQAGSIHRVDGYSVHVLPHRSQLGYMRMVGLLDKLKLLRPDVIQTFTVGGWIALDATIARLFFGSRLFTGSHRCACTFPVEQLSNSLFSTPRISNLLLRETPGRITSLFTEKCYAATQDCAMVAARFMGMQRRKVMVQHLGFDSATCHPLNSEGARAERTALRRRLGFAPDDLVVINTGKLNSQRNGLLLAQTVGHLRAKSLPFRGLFIGCGSQSDRDHRMRWMHGATLDARERTAGMVSGRRYRVVAPSHDFYRR